MRKKLLSVLLCTAMAATMLTGCGGSDTKKDSSKEAKKVTVSDGGKVLNIRVWNEEFKSRMTDHYPGYKKVRLATLQLSGRSHHLMIMHIRMHWMKLLRSRILQQLMTRSIFSLLRQITH